MNVWEFDPSTNVSVAPDEMLFNEAVKARDVVAVVADSDVVSVGSTDGAISPSWGSLVSLS